MNNIKNRYLYFEKETEKEFNIVLSTIERKLKILIGFKKTILFATFFALNTTFKVLLELIGLFFKEPTIYRTEEPNKEEKIEPTRTNTWRAL